MSPDGRVPQPEAVGVLYPGYEESMRALVLDLEAAGHGPVLVRGLIHVGQGDRLTRAAVRAIEASDYFHMRLDVINGWESGRSLSQWAVDTEPDTGAPLRVPETIEIRNRDLAQILCTPTGLVLGRVVDEVLCDVTDPRLRPVLLDTLAAGGVRVRPSTMPGQTLRRRAVLRPPSGLAPGRWSAHLIEERVPVDRAATIGTYDLAHREAVAWRPEDMGLMRRLLAVHGLTAVRVTTGVPERSVDRHDMLRHSVNPAGVALSETLVLRDSLRGTLSPQAEDLLRITWYTPPDGGGCRLCGVDRGEPICEACLERIMVGRLGNTRISDLYRGNQCGVKAAEGFRQSLRYLRLRTSRLLP